MKILRSFGRLEALSPSDRRLFLERTLSIQGPAVSTTVRELLVEVQTRGDAAVRDQMQRFGGVTLKELSVPSSAWRAALERLPGPLVAALERAARNLRTVHAAQLPIEICVEPEPGIRVGRRPDPLSRVGVYAPGGRAAYPSSLLMGVIPAKVAGVREVVVTSPAQANGMPSDVVLAAALIAGADVVLGVGGAAAIAALAYGTETIPRVDRIVGPGNAYVAEAKRQIQAVCGIDSPAGPSELLIIADRDASPDVIADELLAQAEHDPDATVIALVEGEPTAIAALNALEEKCGPLRGKGVALEALATRGGILWTDELSRAFGFANDFAAEHLLLLTRSPREDLGKLQAAGAVFLGPFSSVAFGDYLTGANHVLPTAGTARGASGLSTADFLRWTSWQEVSSAAAASLAPDTSLLAEAEGLPSHAAAARRAGGIR